MVKPSTRPRRQKADDGSINALFTGAADPALDTDLQAEAAEAAKTKGEDPNAALLAQIAALNARVEELGKVSNFSLQSQPTVAQGPKEPQLDLSGLPDAQYDNDNYNKALQARTQQFTKDMLSYQRSVDEASRTAAQGQKSKAEGLWDDFREAYPDHAEHDDLVLFATQKVVDRAKSNGMDAEKFMFNNRPQFMKEVAETMEKVRGAPFKAEDEEPANRGQEPEDEEPMRTSMFGSGNSIPRTKADTKALQGDMISEIHELQRKTGFF